MNIMRNISSIILISLSFFAIGDQVWLRNRTHENIEVMKFADAHNAKLSEKAIKVEVNESYSSWKELYIYYMAGGSIIKCTRGFLGNAFIYYCKENQIESKKDGSKQSNVPNKNM